MHNLDPVAICHRQLCPLGPRCNLAVQLHRNPIRSQLQPL